MISQVPTLVVSKARQELDSKAACRPDTASSLGLERPESGRKGWKMGITKCLRKNRVPHQIAQPQIMMRNLGAFEPQHHHRIVTSSLIQRWRTAATIIAIPGVQNFSWSLLDIWALNATSSRFSPFIQMRQDVALI